VLLAGDTKPGKEVYMASDPYTVPLAVHQRYETTHTLSPRFRTLLLTGGASEVGLALVRH
jgi:hypothetical protein